MRCFPMRASISSFFSCSVQTMGSAQEYCCMNTPLKLADGVLIAAHECLKIRVRQVHPHPQAPPAAQEHLLRAIVPQGVCQLLDSAAVAGAVGVLSP